MDNKKKNVKNKPVLHQSLVSPVITSVRPGSQSFPQLQIVVHLQLFGVVVSGSATNEVVIFRSLFEPNSSTSLSREKGQEAAGMKIDERHFDKT